MRQITRHESQRLEAIAQACRLVSPQLISAESIYRIQGKRSDGMVLIDVRSASLAQAERLYRATYQKLIYGGHPQTPMRGSPTMTQRAPFRFEIDCSIRPLIPLAKGGD